MPTYIYVVTRKPSRDGEDPGAIEESWFDTVGGEVLLTTQDGTPLPGERNRRKPRKGQSDRECARAMLQAKVRAMPHKPFSRPLRYQKTGWL
jgi:hypothetical protein